jgi:hypothetical protein
MKRSLPHEDSIEENPNLAKATVEPSRTSKRAKKTKRFDDYVDDDEDYNE